MFWETGTAAVNVVDCKPQHLSLLEFVIHYKLLGPGGWHTIHIPLCPVSFRPSLLALGEHHTHGVWLGHDVPVQEILTCDGELHPGHRQRGGARRSEWAAAVRRRGGHGAQDCLSWEGGTITDHDYTVSVVTCRPTRPLSANEMTHTHLRQFDIVWLRT